MAHTYTFKGHIYVYFYASHLATAYLEEQGCDMRVYGFCFYRFTVFHDSFVKSVMNFGLICCWSHSKTGKLNKTYTIPCEIVGCCTPDTSLEQLYK